MDSHRFDSLARAVFATGTLPRRGLFGLAALALPGAAGIASGKKRKPKRCRPACAACLRCVKGRCKPDAAQDGDACLEGVGECASGDCVASCPAGQWSGASCPQGQCCPDGQVCLSEGGCGTCPTEPDFCAAATGAGLRACGSVGAGAAPDCACVTSKQGNTTCSSLFGDCVPCTTDAQCTTWANGAPAVCVDAAECGGCPSGDSLCMLAGCVAPPPSAARASSGGPTWRRIGSNRIRP